jgi:hypothetical protein
LPRPVALYSSRRPDIVIEAVKRMRRTNPPSGGCTYIIYLYIRMLPMKYLLQGSDIYKRIHIDNLREKFSPGPGFGPGFESCQGENYFS